MPKFIKKVDDFEIYETNNCMYKVMYALTCCKCNTTTRFFEGQQDPDTMNCMNCGHSGIHVTYELIDPPIDPPKDYIPSLELIDQEPVGQLNLFAELVS